MNLNLELLWALSKRELLIRYKSTALGFFWSILHPIIYLSIFTAVFSQVFNSIDNYPMYVISGLIFWIFFSTTVNMITMAMVVNGRFIKSFEAPAIFFPLSCLISSMLNFFLSLIPFFIIFIIFGGHSNYLAFLQLIPLIILLALFVFGFGLILSTLNVFFRDVNLLWLALTPMMFYSSPIAYTLDIIPQQYVKYLQFNPMVHFLEAVHTSLYAGEWISLKSWGILIALTLVAMGMGYLIYKKLEKGLISYL